jgi:hypothetical protein
VSVWVELWVRLKVVDLVAQTAWLTLTEKLDFTGRIHGLIHYSYWGFTAGGGDVDAILGGIDRVVRFDSAFTNQNKHRYRLVILENTEGRGIPLGNDGAVASSIAPHEPSSLGAGRGDLPLERDFMLHEEPAGDARSDLYVLDCLIRERRGYREAGYEDRLNGRLRGVRVSNMKAGELWRIVVSAASGDDALRTAERIAITRSRREGLLLNPHYQRLEIVSFFPLPREALREHVE